MYSKFAKILLVDDSEFINSIDRAIVKNTHLFKQIETISNGTDTIKYFTNTNPIDFPEILILDLYLGDYHGYEVLDEIEDIEGFSKVAVIILSSSRNKRDFEKYNRYNNLIGFLKKPLIKQKLINLLESV